MISVFPCGIHSTRCTASGRHDAYAARLHFILPAHITVSKAASYDIPNLKIIMSVIPKRSMCLIDLVHFAGQGLRELELRMEKYNPSSHKFSHIPIHPHIFYNPTTLYDRHHSFLLFMIDMRNMGMPDKVSGYNILIARYITCI